MNARSKGVLGILTALALVISGCVGASKADVEQIVAPGATSAAAAQMQAEAAATNAEAARQQAEAARGEQANLIATLTAPTGTPTQTATPDPVTLFSTQLAELAAQVVGGQAVYATPIPRGPNFLPGPGGQYPSYGNLNEEGYSGPTTAQAKVDAGVDVQRLFEESASFVRRTYPTVENVRCQIGYVCTFTLSDGSIKVFVGDGNWYDASAETFRYVNAFPLDDAVRGNPPCELVVQEDNSGAVDNPTFDVLPGNFTCSGMPASTSFQPGAVTTAVVNRSCPVFGGVITTLLTDGGCKFSSSIGPVTAEVPQGWWAWDGVRHEGGQLTTSEVTLYRDGS